MWREYFGEGTIIVGVDIEPKCRAYERDGVVVLIGEKGVAREAEDKSRRELVPLELKHGRVGIRAFDNQVHVGQGRGRSLPSSVEYREGRVYIDAFRPDAEQHTRWNAGNHGARLQKIQLAVSSRFHSYTGTLKIQN